MEVETFIWNLLINLSKRILWLKDLLVSGFVLHYKWTYQLVTIHIPFAKMTDFIIAFDTWIRWIQKLIVIFKSIFELCRFCWEHFTFFDDDSAFLRFWASLRESVVSLKIRVAFSLEFSDQLLVFVIIFLLFRIRGLCYADLWEAILIFFGIDVVDVVQRLTTAASFPGVMLGVGKIWGIIDLLEGLDFRSSSWSSSNFLLVVVWHVLVFIILIVCISAVTSQPSSPAGSRLSGLP